MVISFQKQAHIDVSVNTKGLAISQGHLWHELLGTKKSGCAKSLTTGEEVI